MRVWIILLFLIIVISVSGCITQGTELSIKELNGKAPFYLNKHVIVEGKAKVSTALCTTIFCGEDNPCCNACGASLLLTDGDRDILLFGQYDNKRVGCEGTECSINCYPLTAGSNYKVTGLWKAQADKSHYYLQIEGFEIIK